MPRIRGVGRIDWKLPSPVGTPGSDSPEFRFRIVTNVHIARQGVEFECARYADGQYQNLHGIPEDGLKVIPRELREIARRISLERQYDAVVWYYGVTPVEFVLTFQIGWLSERPEWATSYVETLARKFSRWIASYKKYLEVRPVRPA